MKKMTAIVLFLVILACIGMAAAEEADLDAMFQEARQASMNGDAAKANELFEQLYTLGDARGAEMLATAYQNGDGVEQDYTKAMEWNFRAVNMGSGRGWANVGQRSFPTRISRVPGMPAYCMKRDLPMMPVNLSRTWKRLPRAT